jgi:hypothetical protein
VPIRGCKGRRRARAGRCTDSLYLSSKLTAMTAAGHAGRGTRRKRAVASCRRRRLRQGPNCFTATIPGATGHCPRRRKSVLAITFHA